jgi:hypothetical protein
MCTFLPKHVKVFLPLAEDPVESKLAVRQPVRALARKATTTTSAIRSVRLNH